MNFLLIALGSALGGVSRYWLSDVFATHTQTPFPWGTLFINITGSFIIAAFGSLTSSDGPFMVSPLARQFVMVGLCGGYTTFSSFSLQTIELLQKGNQVEAFGNVLLSVISCLLAAWVGIVVGTHANQLLPTVFSSR